MRIAVTQQHLPYYRFRCIVTYCNPGKCMWPTSPVLIGTRPPRYLLVKTEKRQQRTRARARARVSQLQSIAENILPLAMLIQFLSHGRIATKWQPQAKKAPGMTHQTEDHGDVSILSSEPQPQLVNSVTTPKVNHLVWVFPSSWSACYPQTRVFTDNNPSDAFAMPAPKGTNKYPGFVGPCDLDSLTSSFPFLLIITLFLPQICLSLGVS